MEVAREKLVAPSLFDVVAPRPAVDSSATTGGPSFHECLQPSAKPTPRERQEQAKAASSNDTSSPKSDPPQAEDVTSQAAEDTSGEENAEEADVAAEQPTKKEAAEEEDLESDDDVVAAALAAVLPAQVEPVKEEVVASEDEKPAPEAVDDATAKPKSKDEKVQLTPTNLDEPDLFSLDAPKVAKAAEASEVPTETAKAQATAAPVAAVQAVVEEVAPETDAEAEARDNRGERKVPGKVVDSSTTSEAKVSDVATKGEPGEIKPVAHEGKIVVPEELKHEEQTALPEDAAVERPSAEKLTVEPAPVAAPVADASTLAADATNSASSPVSTDVGQANSSTSQNTVYQGNVPKAPSPLVKAKGAHDEAARAAEIDPAKFLNRVVKAFHSAQQRDGEVKLRLHPAELGSLAIEVKIQDGALTAHLKAETSEARTALVENLPMLRERLAEQGIRIEKFDVDLMDHSDRQPQESFRDQAREQGERRTAEAAKRLRTDSESPTAPLRASAASGLNVVI